MKSKKPKVWKGFTILFITITAIVILFGTIKIIEVCEKTGSAKLSSETQKQHLIKAQINIITDKQRKADKGDQKVQDIIFLGNPLRDWISLTTYNNGTMCLCVDDNNTFQELCLHNIRFKEHYTVTINANHTQTVLRAGDQTAIKKINYTYYDWDEGQLVLGGCYNPLINYTHCNDYDFGGRILSANISLPVRTKEGMVVK